MSNWCLFNKYVLGIQRILLKGDLIPKKNPHNKVKLLAKPNNPKKSTNHFAWKAKLTDTGCMFLKWGEGSFDMPSQSLHYPLQSLF